MAGDAEADETVRAKAMGYAIVVFRHLHHGAGGLAGAEQHDAAAFCRGGKVRRQAGLGAGGIDGGGEQVLQQGTHGGGVGHSASRVGVAGWVGAAAGATGTGAARGRAM